MAQTSISTFFAVRRKRTEEHGILKRRKLADGRREEITRGVDETTVETKVIAKRTPVPPAAVLKSPARTKSKTSEFSPQLQKFEAFEIESPTKKKPSSSRRLTYDQCRALAQPTTPSHTSPSITSQSSSKSQPPLSSSVALPAYQRFSALALPHSYSSKHKTQPETHSEAQPHSQPTLPLPYKYRVLAEKFRSMDTVVSMLQKRMETCTFDKLKKAVQEMTRRNFEMRDLAQIKTVYPEAYRYRQERTSQQRCVEYKLTVEAIADEEISSGTGRSIALMKRKEHFIKRLTKIVIQHHKEFLASLDPPVEVPEEKLFRWHPSFPLDSLPDVEEADLPKPPQTEVYSTASDVLAATHTRITARMKKALSDVAKQAESKREQQTKSENKKQSSSTNPSSSAPSSRLLDGVSTALLERVRLKEVAKATATMTRSPEKEKQLEMCARLHEVCRILRIFFVAEKKAAILWDTVVQKLSESHSSGLEPNSVEEHLELLLTLLPKWVTKVSVKKRTYLKINKETSLKLLTSELQRKEEGLKK